MKSQTSSWQGNIQIRGKPIKRVPQRADKVERLSSVRFGRRNPETFDGNKCSLLDTMWPRMRERASAEIQAVLQQGICSFVCLKTLQNKSIPFLITSIYHYLCEHSKQIPFIISETLGYCLVCHVFSRHLDVISDLLLNRPTQHGLSVKRNEHQPGLKNVLPLQQSVKDSLVIVGLH